MTVKTKKKRKVVKRARIVSNEEQTQQLEALSTVMLSNKHTRIILANASLEFFSQYYFNITLAKHQIRWINKLVRVKRGVVLAPCGHGKTEVFSKILILWMIVRNRDIRILLTSKSDGLAVKNLKAIRNELQSNKRLISDFGRFYDNDSTWSDHQLYCIRNKNLKDPTLEAVGLLGAITGGRFDIIVLDDVIDVLNSRSEDQRRKIQDYIDGTLQTRLEPWGICWGVGTRKHYDDYYAYLIKNKAWVVIHDKAIWREPGSYKLIETKEPIEMEDPVTGEKHEVYFRCIITSEDRGECEWPNKWSMENLLLLRNTIGPLVFQREYQNIISSDEFALFKIKELEQCRDFDLSYENGTFYTREQRIPYIAIVQGSDLALVDDKQKAEKEDTDYTVILTWGVKQTESVLLGWKRVRGETPGEIRDIVEEEYNRFNVDHHFMEVNAFGMIQADSLINDKGLDKIHKHYTTGKKHDIYTGVPGMSVKFYNKSIRLPYKTAHDQKRTDKLITEFHGLGVEKHDDIVMSAWVGHCGIDRIKLGIKRITKTAKRLKKPVRVKNVRRKEEERSRR